MIFVLTSRIDLNIFSPTEPLGIIILFIGLIFSGMIFYIIYAVSTNKESIEDKKIRIEREIIQKDKIGKLFPKKKWTLSFLSKNKFIHFSTKSKKTVKD